MEAKINYICGDESRDIVLRLIQVRGENYINGWAWALEVTHKKPAPEADFVFNLSMSEAKMLHESLGSFVNTLEWLWKNEKR